MTINNTRLWSFLGCKGMHTHHLINDRCFKAINLKKSSLHNTCLCLRKWPHYTDLDLYDDLEYRHNISHTNMWLQPGRGGGVSRQNCWYGGSAQAWKMDPIGSDRGQTKEVNGIGNWEERGQLDWISTQSGVNQIEPRCLRGLRMLKRAPNRIENLKNEGHHRGTSLPCPSMGVPPPLPRGSQLHDQLVFVLVSIWRHHSKS